jgi:hypothetical protein
MSSLALTRMITEITLPNAAAARESAGPARGKTNFSSSEAQAGRGPRPGDHRTAGPTGRHDGVQGGGPGPLCCTGKERPGDRHGHGDAADIRGTGNLKARRVHRRVGGARRPFTVTVCPSPNAYTLALWRKMQSSPTVNLNVDRDRLKPSRVLTRARPTALPAGSRSWPGVGP